MATKTLKKFEAEVLGKSFGYGFKCNKVFSFKPWFEDEELTYNGKPVTIFVAAEHTKGHGWEALYAEVKETGKELEMVCTYGTSKADLMDQILGC